MTELNARSSVMDLVSGYGLRVRATGTWFVSIPFVGLSSNGIPMYNINGKIPVLILISKHVTI